MDKKQTVNNFSKIPNELFYFAEKNQDPSPKKRKLSILVDTKIDNKFNYKALFILDYLYMNSNRRKIINFYLKDIITECGFKYNTRENQSCDQFRYILSKLQERKTIGSCINLANIKPSEKIICTLDIDLSNQFSVLYDKDKDKILNQNIDKTADNKSLLVYYCYLNCKMYRRPKGDDIHKSGGRAEIAYPSFKLINTELGFVDDTITVSPMSRQRFSVS